MFTRNQANNKISWPAQSYTSVLMRLLQQGAQILSGKQPENTNEGSEGTFYSIEFIHKFYSTLWQMMARPSYFAKRPLPGIQTD